MSSKNPKIDTNEKEVTYQKQNKKIIIISLVSVGFVALLLRFNYIFFDLPLTLDALLYFWYSIDTSQLGYFPSDYKTVTNNGWPAFLSLFFSVYQSDNFMDYMSLQKLVSISLSVITLVPVYLLCRKFVGNLFAIFGAALFVFEPRIVQNSLFGITEPLLLFLLSTSVLLFLNEKMKFVFISFAITALAAMVRAEAIILFLGLSIAFFWKYRHQKRDLVKFIVCLSIFLLVLLPMMVIRINTIGEDGIVSRIVSSQETLELNAINRGLESNNSNQQLVFGISNFVKFLGWSTIPSFLVFAPLGYILIIKHRNNKRNFVLFISAMLAIPAVYALSTASDTRYLFTLYPLFCVASAITLEFFSKKLNNNKMIIPLVIIAVLITSIGYLEYKKIDYDHEKEAFDLATIVTEKTNRIILYPPESQYLAISELLRVENFPIIRSTDEIPFEQTEFGWPILKNFKSMNDSIEYLEENNITHLVLDGKENRNEFLNEVYYSEEDFPYLEKIYDSSEHNFEYHLKIYEINYQKWNENIIEED